jgi:hypothetical protein
VAQGCFKQGGEDFHEIGIAAELIRRRIFRVLKELWNSSDGAYIPDFVRYPQPKISDYKSVRRMLELKDCQISSHADNVWCCW